MNDSTYPSMQRTEDWGTVVRDIPELYVKYAYNAKQLIAADPDNQDGWQLETPELGTVFIKHADFLPWVGKAMHGAQRAIGGPNPLTSMLLGGALGAGVGGLGGYIGHKLMPKYLRPDAWKRFGGMGFLGGAALPGVVHGYPNVAQRGWRGIFEPSELQGGTPYAQRTKGQIDTSMQPGVPDTRFGGILDKILGKQSCDDPYLEKCANPSGGYGANISTEDWRHIIMRDKYLDPREKAIIAGLPVAAGASRGSRWVSPVDVAKVAANAGLGAFFGKALGAIAGPFLALTPAAKQGIQNAGMLAGALKMITGI